MKVTMDDLVERGGLYYQKITDVPFDGKVTGKTEQGSFTDGKKDGSWEWYHDNGQIETQGTYKDGEKDGSWECYYDNGQLWEKGTYKDGNRDGPWVGYLPDGTVWEEHTGTYKNDVKISD